MNARLLLTGVGGPAGRSLLVQLAERGLDAVGVDMSPSPVPDDVPFHLVPAARDPRFADELRRIVAAEGVDLVVPTVTEELVVLAAGLDIGAPVVVGPLGAVRAADDKLATARALATGRVPAPRTFGGSDFANLTMQALGVLGTPWLSKPRSGRGGRGVEIHHAPPTTDDVTRARAEDRIWQEYASGEEYAPNLYLAADPADDVVVVLRKTALAHGEHGNAVGVERLSGPEHADAGLVALLAARALGLRGPIDVDVRRRSDGAPVVLEINARFGANSAHAPEILDALLAEHVGLDSRTTGSARAGAGAPGVS